MSTIFTQIINREIPADIVYEDEMCLAFRDINPQAPVHVLLIPKKQIVSMATVEMEDQVILGHLMVKASEIASSLGLGESGYRLVVNTNADAGQSVFHLHIHILGGRKLTWPPG
ncbi:MAG: histidine triad nucleotide-binding protein [Candidatus Dadabacteria bacterium]|nr:histidine triad nucleotide-binding protein [Candidatus Dadabacteria bacterium]MCY4263156.1 histidine triad nucleotide-binding protein [Candidatus Dadabacteria bacterium]